MKKFVTAILFSLTAFILFSKDQQGRSRNMVYVLDCTQSMSGFNGSPNIWAPTKAFLKDELEKERKENPAANITILPFQDKVMQPIRFSAKDVDWGKVEIELDQLISRVTPTNICDAWLRAEKEIDDAQYDNYIVLMTDGHDNIGGTANEINRMKKLESILEAFCNANHDNTKGFYLELTQAASLPENVNAVVRSCKDLFVIDATHGIPNFGSLTKNEMSVNTRDLPKELEVGFSNAGRFIASIAGNGDKWIDVSLIDGIIEGGKCRLLINSKYGDDIDALNSKIGEKGASVEFSIVSDDVIITNGELTIDLCTANPRTMDMQSENILTQEITRIKPFLWIKGGDSDTLRWSLNANFNDEAIKDQAYARFKMSPKNNIDSCELLFNGAPVVNGFISVAADKSNVVELVVHRGYEDGEVEIALDMTGVENLDRVNGEQTDTLEIVLKGEVSTSTSWLEWAVRIAIAAIVAGLILWFAFIKKQKYPTFNKGILTINDPYFATVKLKGFRKVVFTSAAKHQGLLNRIFTGKIKYHVNSAWTGDAEITPSGKNNKRFRSVNGQLISEPSPIWQQNGEYKIVDSNNQKDNIIKISLS